MKWLEIIGFFKFSNWTWIAYTNNYIIIQPLDTNFDSDKESNDDGVVMPIYGGHHDAISDALQVGDNFATNPSEEG